MLKTQINSLINKNKKSDLKVSADFLEDLFSILRETALEVNPESTCIATFNYWSGVINVNSKLRLTKSLLLAVKESLHKEGVKYNPELSEPDELLSCINGKEEDKYFFKEKELNFSKNIIVPLKINSKVFGFVFVGTLSKKSDFVNQTFIKKLENEFTSAFTYLWKSTQKQAQKYESLITSVIDGVILCDSNNIIQFINKAALRMLSVPNDCDCLGKSLSILNAEYLTQFLEEALKNGLHEINKVIQAPGKKSKLIGVHTELLKTKSNTEIGWMIVLRDVTMNWQNDQMRSALSIASHEIKTPVNSIASAVELLIDKDLGTLNEKQEHCLSVIKDDIKRLNRLLGDILDLSKYEEGVKFIDRRKEIALNFLVNKVIYSFHAYAKTKNIKIENKISKDIPTFRGDRDHLQQVLANLIENSLKYSLPNTAVEIEAVLNNSILKFSVRDQGVGIPSDQFDAIFERFKQLDNYPEEGERGYGLGLSIAKQIIENSSGKIWVESEVGKGSTFYFTIPV